MVNVTKLLFPTDFSNLAHLAWPWAQRMAGALDADIHCIYVVDSPAVYGTLGMEPIPASSIEDLVATAERQLQRFIDDHHAGGGGLVLSKVLVGSPADKIVAYAKDVDAGLIVMSTHGYSGLRHIMLGSTAEAVLRHAQCPVLSVPQRQIGRPTDL